MSEQTPEAVEPEVDETPAGDAAGESTDLGDDPDGDNTPE